jgi:hypothetical protein
MLSKARDGALHSQAEFARALCSERKVVIRGNNEFLEGPWRPSRQSHRTEPPRTSQTGFTMQFVAPMGAKTCMVNPMRRGPGRSMGAPSGGGRGGGSPRALKQVSISVFPSHMFGAPRYRDTPGYPGVSKDTPRYPQVTRGTPAYTGVPRDTPGYPGIPRGPPGNPGLRTQSCAGHGLCNSDSTRNREEMQSGTLLYKLCAAWCKSASRRRRGAHSK